MLSPLSAPSWLVELPLEGFAPARVAIPLGSERALPLALVLHGDAGRPEWACGSYRALFGSRAFVLCPSGQARSDGRLSLASAEPTTRELRAALPALKRRFGGHLAPGSVVLAAAGGSADAAFDLALAEAGFFSRLVLLDAPLERLNAAFASRFGDSGGKRVLVVCSQGACRSDMEARVRMLGPAGVDARWVRSPGQGLDADTVAALKREWAWFLGGERPFQ